ncbi:TlpA family protein disulfide reductase [bacterium]|nr:MAG: TlpA family protein disulfide reductase [bacterium]
MGTPKRSLALLGTLAATACALAGGEPTKLLPGAPAPPLSFKRWVKGKPVTKLEKGKVYVFEFWATWCGPCKEAMPHLSKLARANKDVTFVGVGIGEEDKGDKIDAFVKRMGDKMDYNVAYSGFMDGMAETWMKPFGRTGIPCTFIVKDNRVLWVGHPDDMEKPLAEIKAGTFDLPAFLAEWTKNDKVQDLLKAKDDARRAAIALFDEGRRDEARTALDAWVAKFPDMAAEARRIRFIWSYTDDPVAWERTAKEMAASGDRTNISRLSYFAGWHTRKPEDFPLARKAIAILLEGTGRKDFDLLISSAHNYKNTGDYRLALDAYNDAMLVKPSEGDSNAATQAYWERLKKEIEEKLAAAGGG